MDIVLVDISWVLHSRWYAMANSKGGHLRAPDGTITSHYKSADTVLDLYDRFGGRAKIILCWDSKFGSVERKKIFPEYKSNRISSSSVQDWDRIKEFFSYMGVTQAWGDTLEADDVISTLTKYFLRKHEYGSVVIYSKDKDFRQLLVDDRVFILESKNGELIRYHDVIEEFGVRPEKLAMLRAFLGDYSDNIPRASKRMKTKLCQYIVNCWDSLESFYNQYESGMVVKSYSSKRYSIRPPGTEDVGSGGNVVPMTTFIASSSDIKHIEKAKENVFRNYKLMKLIEYPIEQIRFFNRKPDREKFFLLANKLGMLEFMRRIRNYDILDNEDTKEEILS